MLYYFTAFWGLLGLWGLRRYQKFSRIEARYFPEVDPSVFAKWYARQRSSVQIFLWSVFGTLAVLFGTLHAQFTFRLWASLDMVHYWIAMTLLPVPGLAWSAIQGHRAKQLGIHHGINTDTVA